MTASPDLDRRRRALVLVVLLGLALAVALWPYASGLIGAPVLFVVFAPVHRWLARRMAPALAAGLVVALCILLLLGPGLSFLTLLASEVSSLAGQIEGSDLVARLSALRIAGYDVGAELGKAGSRVASLVGSLLVSLFGGATRAMLQLTVSFFGLFYLLVEPHRAWTMLRPFVPFSDANTELLRRRFEGVTISTLVGTFAVALLQGLFLGGAFALAGLPSPLLWGVVTVVLSILPVVGAGLVWVPAVAALALQQRYVAAGLLAAWSLVVVGNVDTVVRPWVFRRYASIHPFVTIIGALAGVGWFGLLGLLIGPLAISYFFELIRMYREEFGLTPLAGAAAPPAPAAAAPPPPG